MRRIGIMAALALAGCASGEYQLREAHGGGAGLPMVAMRASQAEVVPPGRDTPLGLAVRSFVPGADGAWTEVAGAHCRVTGGSYFRADLVTPARLTLPDLGPDAPPLRAECNSGTARGADVVAPVFSWADEGRPSGVERVRWGGGWWWGFQKTGPMRYPDLAVGMREPGRA